MNGGMERFDATAEYFRRARELLDRRHGQPGGLDGARRAAACDQLPTQFVQRAREGVELRFVVHRQ